MEIEEDKKGFAVEPITNCPHFKFKHQETMLNALKTHKTELFKKPCVDCDDRSENWICLDCGNIYCSRYKQAHMALHNEKSKDHELAMSFSDFSFWCYSCDFYVTNDVMANLRIASQKYKFGKEGNYNNLSTEEEKLEFFDSPEEVDKKVDILANMIKNSNHFIAFTGAGVSTAAGIPDFRSGTKTVLKTGPGAWEERATGCDTSNTERVSMLCAHPTKSHLALNQLEQNGFLKFLISQNTDGIHRRSNFPPEKLAELHGNTNLEKCSKCSKQYFRDFCTRSDFAVGRTDHISGRLCEDPQCKGDLNDSIINFGENLPQKELEGGFSNAQQADVCLALGSSLRVTPAANMPETVGKKYKKVNGKGLVIINLQKTPLDSVASLKINAMCDDVMNLLMQKLNLQIPEFELRRTIKVTNNNNQVNVTGVNEKGENYSLFKKVVYQNQQLIKEPYNFQVQGQNLTFRLTFQGHYREPELDLNVDTASMKNGVAYYYLVFNPRELTWNSRQI